MAAEKKSGRQPVPHLKSWRLAKLLSQAKLAEQAHVGEITISRIENGEKANELTIYRLAQGLGITPHQLMNEEPSLNEYAA